jgi:hypothetical protein
VLADRHCAQPQNVLLFMLAAKKAAAKATPKKTPASLGVSIVKHGGSLAQQRVWQLQPQHQNGKEFAAG